MEHNFTFNSVDEMNLVNDIITFFYGNDNKYLRQLNGVVNFDSYPHMENYPASISDIIDRLSGAIVSALEEEKPKYEHRYSVVNGYDGTLLKEFDDLNDAFEYYKSLYADEYSIHCRADDTDYILIDNKYDITVTDRVPCLEFEYEWEADLRIRLDGRTVYDANDYVMEEIAEQFAGGDTEGYVNEEIGDVDWDDIENWEAEHDKEEQKEETPAAPAESTEAEPAEDNTWHIY